MYQYMGFSPFEETKVGVGLHLFDLQVTCPELCVGQKWQQSQNRGQDKMVQSHPLTTPP